MFPVNKHLITSAPGEEVHLTACASGTSNFPWYAVLQRDYSVTAIQLYVLFQVILQVGNLKSDEMLQPIRYVEANFCDLLLRNPFVLLIKKSFCLKKKKLELPLIDWPISIGPV